MPSHSRQDELRALTRLDELLDLPRASRKAWLDGLTAESDGVRAALAELLTQLERVHADGFLMGQAMDHTDRPVEAPAEQVPTDAAPQREPDQLVGPWRLIRLLGRGGMAQVWLAERSDGAHRRQVALKLPHVDSGHLPISPRAQVLAERFLRERAILSSLRHPHIAQVLDAGSHAQQAWLALEFVDGVPITEYVSSQGLDVAARLGLFLQVLQAVAHAHERLVLHRDIKPANVLVDQQGQVKLLDFGVAKLLHIDTGDNSADTAGLTQLGGRAMTLQYASPEQIGGAPLGTASDVYSLGVLLYELLTGRLPYVTKRGTAAALEEAILDSHRLLPSQAVTLPDVARQLRGDIDTVVMKALQFDPNQRYASASALALDIDRYLHHLPIAARPDALGYRLQKLWRRQKLALTAAGAVATALLLGLGIALWQVQQTRQQFAQALARQQASQAVQLLIEGSMNSTGNDGQPRDVVAGLVLIESMARQMYRDFPELQAEVLMLLGAKYGSLQQPLERKRLMADAHQAARRSGVAPLIATTECRTVYAYADDALPRIQAAVAGLQKGAEFARARFECYGFMATLLAWDGRADEAEQAARAAEAELPALGPLAPLLVPDMHETRGDVARASGRFEQAGRHYAAALASLQDSGRARTLQAAVLLNYRVLMLLSIGRPQQALALSDELQTFFDRMGSSADMPAYMLTNRSTALLALGRVDAAESTARLAVQRALDTKSVTYEGGARARLVDALIAQGQTEQAALELALREAALKTLGEPDTDGRTELLQAQLALATNQAARASQWLNESEKRLSGSNFDKAALVQALLLQARAQLSLGDRPAAGSSARRALALCQSMGDAPSLQMDQARQLLAQVGS